MYKEVLSEDQLKLLPLIGLFSKDFVLVGGTAIALFLGHRRSIDFDLFTFQDFSKEKVRNIVNNNGVIQSILVDEPDELTLVTGNVKFTFYRYPFELNYTEKLDNYIGVPDLLTLSAMKAFALGRRAKWKDYVDIFFILKNHSFESITKKAKDIYGLEFNERLFREQLAYYEDVDYSETVDYLKGHEVPDSLIKQTLSELSAL